MKNGLSSLILESSNGIVTFAYISQATRLYSDIGTSVYTIIMNWSLIASLLLGSIFEIAGYGFTHSLVGVFTSDSEVVVAAAERAIRIYLPAFILMDVAICGGAFFQAVNTPVQAFIIMLLRGIALPILLVVTLPISFGTGGLWAAVPIAEALTSLIAGVLLLRALKKFRVEKNQPARHGFIPLPKLS